MAGLRLLLACALLAAIGQNAPASAQNIGDKMPTCLACHGENGQSQNENVPSLGAQTSPYSLIQLVLFREGLRTADPMNDLMKGVSDSDLQAFADAIAKLPPPKPAEAGDTQRLAHGQQVAAQNRCLVCHRADLSGQENVPRLADQREDYLLKSLRDYKSGARHGYDASMADVVQPMSDADFVDAAYFIARAK